MPWKRSKLGDPPTGPERSSEPSAGQLELEQATVSGSALAKCSAAAARALVPFVTAERLCILPLGCATFKDTRSLTVACVAAHASEARQALRFIFDGTIRLVPVDEAALREAILIAYKGDGNVLHRRVDELDRWAQETPERVVIAAPESAGTPVTSFLNSLIEYAHARAASDIHLVASSEGTKVQLRIDGELVTHERTIGLRATHDQLINRIKVLAKLDVAKRSIPQEGSLLTPFGSSLRQLRVSIMPTVEGEKAVLRLSPAQDRVRFELLGFDERTAHGLRSVLERREGAILFAGATGSGKTTSMYALLDELRDKNLSLVSVEDPVEIRLPYISQTQVDESQGLGYAALLRSVLRQDPDVVLCGEIRDQESAHVALQAAITGHLVMSTVHARAVPEVLLRFRHFGVDALTIGQSVEMIVCQELLPRLCERCKVVDLAATHAMGSEVYREVGCTDCAYTGWNGRVLVAESVRLTDNVRKLVFGGTYSSEASWRALYELPEYADPRTQRRALIRAGLVSSRTIDPRD